MVIAFTHVGDYTYMASELYSLLYFEELLWITFNFIYKLKNSLWIPLESGQDWSLSSFILAISSKWYAIHNKCLIVYLFFLARNVCSYLQIGSAQATVSTPARPGFITVHQQKWKLSTSINQLYSSKVLFGFRPAVEHPSMYHLFHLSFLYCTLQSCFSMYSLRDWPPMHTNRGIWVHLTFIIESVLFL